MKYIRARRHGTLITLSPPFRLLYKVERSSPGRALDIGCGRGENAVMLAMSGCDVTGIDLAENAISDAKFKAIERHVRVNFIAGNVLQMDRLFQRGRSSMLSSILVCFT